VKTANGSAAIEKALQFASEDDSVAGIAAKEFAETLAGFVKRNQYNSGNFDDDIISFLTIEPEQLNEMDDEVITKFLEACRRKNAVGIMKRFCQICISSWFGVSYEKLLHIGTIVAKAGLKTEGAQVIYCASEKIKAEDNANNA
jgi:hypothetical protein